MLEPNCIISSGCRKIIGNIYNIENLFTEELKNLVGSVVEIKECYEIRTDVFAIPGPQGINLAPHTSILPLDSEENRTDIIAFVDNIRRFSDMPDRGRKYILMMGDCDNMLIQARAQKSNIAVAKNMPSPEKSKIIF